MRSCCKVCLTIYLWHATRGTIGIGITPQVMFLFFGTRDHRSVHNGRKINPVTSKGKYLDTFDASFITARLLLPGRCVPVLGLNYRISVARTAINGKARVHFLFQWKIKRLGACVASYILKELSFFFSTLSVIFIASSRDARAVNRGNNEKIIGTV